MRFFGLLAIFQKKLNLAPFSFDLFPMTISFFVPPANPSEFSHDHYDINSWYEQDLVPTQKNGQAGNVECWIYQSWARLRKAGIACHLCTTLPVEGILITPGSLLPTSYQAPPSLFFVDIVSDNPPHPNAHLYLVQNRTQEKLLPRALFMPHWPQPKLIPRSSARGSRFENISFLGYHSNFAPQLQTVEWTNRLRRELGLYFELKHPDQWHDFSDTDCVLAIRDFSRSRQTHKPASKLYNAWLAGVPFIGGRDSSFAAEGQAGKNYLVATSPDQVIKHLRRLKENEHFRSQLVNHGYQAGRNFTQEKILERWKKLLQETLPELAASWKKQSAWQRFLN